MLAQVASFYLYLLVAKLCGRVADAATPRAAQAEGQELSQSSEWCRDARFRFGSDDRTSPSSSDRSRTAATGPQVMFFQVPKSSLNFVAVGLD